MLNLEDLVSPAVANPPKIEEPALSLLAFAGFGFVPVTQAVEPNGPNNVGVPPDGKNPAGPVALSSVKDVLSAGQYQHPIHGWKLNVTPEAMDKYCAAFSEMANAGVKVPIYADHKPGAATTLGYARALFRGGPEALKKYPELAKLPADQAPLDPKKMYAIHDWANPEAMKMAHGVGQVSVLIDKKMTDGTGKKYGEAVRHIAVTPEPIVPGQGSFTQLAASMLNGAIGVYSLSSLDFSKDADMDDDDDDDDGDYATHKANAGKAADKAKKSGKSDHHIEAAAAHKQAGMSAPSPEERKAHLECAAEHLHSAAYAVGQEAKTPEEKKAIAIKKENREKQLSMLVSPTVLASRK